MDITQLRHFKVLAETENMTRASSELHIAQPALSRTLRNLEQSFSLKFFDREGKRIYLNENGKILLKHINVVLREINDAEIELKEQRKSVDSSVNLLVHAGSKFLPELITGFKKLHPDITLNIIQQSYGEISDGKFDIGIYSSMNPADDEKSETLMVEEIGLAMPISNPLSQLDILNLSEVSNEQFLGLSKGSGLRTIVDEYCKIAGFEPNIVLESDSPSIIYDLIEEGLGVALVPMISWHNICESPAVKFVKIENPHCKRYINMTWHNNRYTSKASILMRKYLKEFFKSI